MPSFCSRSTVQLWWNRKGHFQTAHRCAHSKKKNDAHHTLTQHTQNRNSHSHTHTPHTKQDLKHEPEPCLRRLDKGTHCHWQVTFGSSLLGKLMVLPCLHIHQGPELNILATTCTGPRYSEHSTAILGVLLILLVSAAELCCFFSPHGEYLTTSPWPIFLLLFNTFPMFV